MNNLSFKNIPLLLLPPLFWAGNFVVGKIVHHEIPPFSLAFGRWLVAFIAILPFAWHFMRRDFKLYLQNLRWIFITAIIGVASFNTLIYKGLHHTSTTNALLLNSCIPVLIMLFAALFYQQKLQLLQIIGLILSLMGVLSIVLAGEITRLFSLSFNSGDLWVFSAMVCWALYTLWSKNIPPQINKIGLTALQILITIVALFPLFIWEIYTGHTITLSTQSIAGLLYVGVFPSIIAYLLYQFAVEKMGAMHAGLSIHLMPVFGVLLSIAFLGELFHLHHAIGIVLIASGLLLCNRTR